MFNYFHCTGTQEHSVPFKNLYTLKIKDHNIKEVIKIHYDPKISEVINKQEIDEYTITQLIKTKIDRDSDTYYTIYFHSGAGIDPMFVIKQNIEGSDVKELKRIKGIDITIPGNGFIYVSGNYNEMYNKRRKYKIFYGEIIEVEQPYYYVGIESVTTENLNIYSDTFQIEVVDSFPIGTQVTVLLNKQIADTGYYLIKTQYGLTGWIKIIGNDLVTHIKDLKLRGD